MSDVLAVAAIYGMFLGTMWAIGVYQENPALHRAKAMLLIAMPLAVVYHRLQTLAQVAISAGRRER